MLIIFITRICRWPLSYDPVVPDGPIKNLKPGGYVLCNDWHKTATKMRDKKILN